MLDLFSIAFQAVILILIPVGVGRLIHLVLHRIAQEEFFQVPILTTLAHLQGLLAGLLLIQTSVERDVFTLEPMLELGGPWDITMSEFLLDRANVFSYDPLTIIRLLGEVPSTQGLMAVLVAVVLPLMVMLISLSIWGDMREALQALLASAIQGLWMGWLTVYLVSMLFWIFHGLNVWSLVLLILYLQYRMKEESWWPGE